MYNDVRFNPLITREDVERAAVQLLEPLLPLMSRGCARLHLGDTGAVYPDDIAQMEAFARPLWAIVPMLAGNCQSVLPLWHKWREGIINGTDPKHPEYWGVTVDYDQRLVEMAVFGMGMALAPERFFFDLPKTAQKNLYSWLNQINARDMPKNNWTFFRVLVNMGFLVCGLPYDKERLEKDFEMIEAHYEGDGWYFDYFNQREYYTMWAFHFYSLVYARVMRDKDPERAERFIARARLMAPDFAFWFDQTGEALPYGRSLTYRFAQGAFFAAQAFAGAEAPGVGYGTMKRLLLQNLRVWLQKPIFTRDGVLTIGYGYPNLHMAEGYNAPGSPYWAMKVFLCLALPETHPFWQAAETPFSAPRVSLQQHARLLFSRSDDGKHVIAFEAGNHAHEHSHDEAKYEKFAYSTAFGFSVPKASKLLRDGAFDSTLAVSDDGGDSWRTRYGCDTFELTKERVSFTWHPYPDVKVDTQLIPAGEWHVRVHHIVTARDLHIAEGGFAIARDGNGKITEKTSACSASASAPWGVSAVNAVQGYDRGEIIYPEPNTNLMTPRTLLPTLLACLTRGEHTLICAVLGSRDGGKRTSIPSEVFIHAIPR